MSVHRLDSAAMVTASLIAALATVGCAGPAAGVAAYIPPPIGSSWTYAMRSTGSFGSGTEQLVIRMAEATWEGETVLSYQTDAQHQLHDRNLNLLATTAPGGKPVFRYDPPVGWDWPLEVGRITRRDHVATFAATGQTFPFSSTWTVEALEDVTVPAGTFKAWRLRYADTTGETQVLWSVPDTLGVFAKRTLERSATHRLGPGTREMALTSAPTAGPRQR